MSDETLREEVIKLLRGAQAHVTLEHALEDLKPEWRAHRHPGLHSIWQLLEHTRVAQEDILRYTTDPAWTSPEWPGEYWPENLSFLPEETWQETRRGFESGLDEAVALAQDAERIPDLTASIPHGEGRTYLRQLLLIADHNAYHLGQIVAVRKMLGQWHA